MRYLEHTLFSRQPVSQTASLATVVCDLLVLTGPFHQLPWLVGLNVSVAQPGDAEDVTNTISCPIDVCVCACVCAGGGVANGNNKIMVGREPFRLSPQRPTISTPGCT